MVQDIYNSKFYYKKVFERGFIHVMTYAENTNFTTYSSHLIYLRFMNFLKSKQYERMLVYGAYNEIRQGSSGRGDFHMAWFAFVLLNWHVRTKSLIVIWNLFVWKVDNVLPFTDFRLKGVCIKYGRHTRICNSDVVFIEKIFLKYFLTFMPFWGTDLAVSPFFMSKNN